VVFNHELFNSARQYTEMTDIGRKSPYPAVTDEILGTRVTCAIFPTQLSG